MSDDPSRYLSDIVNDAIDQGVEITGVCHLSDPANPMRAGRVIGKTPKGGHYGPSGILQEKRGIVCIDIVESTKHTDIEQFVKVAILYACIRKTIAKLLKLPNPIIRPELFIPAGDGGFLVFVGEVDAFAFSIHFLLEIEECNKKSNEITKLDIRTAVTWGDVIPVYIPVQDKQKNILGDAINECARMGAQRKFKDKLLVGERYIKEVLELPQNNRNNKNRLVDNMKIAAAGKSLIGLRRQDIIQYESLGECEVKNWKGIVYKVFGKVGGIPIG